MKWVSIYGNAQSKVTPHPAKYAKDVTLRYPIYIPFKGEKLSIRLENFCGDEDVKIESVVISKGSSLSDKQTGDIRNLTFNGNLVCEMKAHGSIVSDVIDYPLKEDEVDKITTKFKINKKKRYKNNEEVVNIDIYLDKE